MAQYTIELRTLMNDEMVMPLINNALSTYPMYIPENELAKEVIPSREELNKKLLNHYKWCEIGFETVGRFIDELEIAMNEIMPYYNQRYKSVETMYVIDDIFGNVNVVETTKETRTGSASSSGSGSASSSANDSTETSSNINSNDKHLESETPQGNIAKTASEIDDVTHADKAIWNKNSSNNSASTSGESSTNSSSTTENESEHTETIEHTYTKKGNQGVNTYAHDIVEFRKTIIDVTMEIIEDRKIKDLFMQVF